jgi:purine nucleosidase
MKVAIESPSLPTRTLLLLLLLFLATSAKGWPKTAVILSTDVGNEIDDQWAITYMLVNPDFNVLGIVSAHGPSLPDPSAHASYEILKDVVENRLGMTVHPPLFEGASLALDGATSPRMNDGVKFIIERSKSYSPANRLTVVSIGAATDVASAIISDPAIAGRIRIVAMAFPNAQRGNEYNVANDVIAWQVLLDSRVPIAIGPGDVCRADLALNYGAAQKLIAQHGPVGAWLWDEYRFWYYRQVKPLRKDDFSKPWMIWDIITLAYLEGMTTQDTLERPHLNSDMSFSHPATEEKVIWVTHVDAERLWQDFLVKLDAYQRTHAIYFAGAPLPPGS